MDYSKVKEVRKEKKLSKSELGRRSKVSRRNIERIEAGDEKVRFKDVEKVYKELGFEILAFTMAQ